MNTMRAARLYGSRDMRLETLPIPEPGPTQVVCRVAYCGICGTDCAIYSGETSFVEKGMIRYPMTLGHEWSGVVTAVGGAVRQVRVGDRVAGDTCTSCGECYHCLVGEYNQCEEQQAVGTVFAWDGAYAEYILMPARNVVKLPDGVSFEHGAMMEPAATALYAVQGAEVGIGDTVAVLGTGPIGLFAAGLARLSGASKVIVVGRQEHKLEIASRLGADVLVNAGREDWLAAVKRLAPRGLDCVIEASGSQELLKQSFQAVHASGRVSSVAFYERIVPEFDVDRIVLNDLRFRGVGGSLHMNRPVLRLFEAGRIDPGLLITSRCSFDDVVSTMENLPRGRVKVMMKVAGDL